MNVRTFGSVLVVTALGVAATQAGVVANMSIGTAAPPATLGGYPMVAFPDDVRPVIGDVDDVPAPGGGMVEFSDTLSHREIGSGWSTWSHGYTGDVYFTGVGETSVSLSLPPNTYAFYFYAEPNSFQEWAITATSNTGASITQSVLGASGAKFYGFYGTDGDTVASISIVAVAGANGFAIGEFGIARQDICTGLRTSGAGGTGAPPATLGRYPMTAFGDDPRPLGQAVQGVAAPGGGAVRFCPSLKHVEIGSGWSTWSHGYTGDVYSTSDDQVTLTLPPGTFAFYFYAEPVIFADYDITAIGNDGSMITQSVDGFFGARYFGFYSCNGGTTITKILIDVDPAANGFAIGEFGIAREPLCVGLGVDLSPGLEPAPPTLGGYDVIPFLPDPRPLSQDVTDALGPDGKVIQFSIPLSHRRIGAGWSTWSHDYTGDVYFTNGALDVTISLPPDTYAFYFYLEPTPFSDVDFIIRANDGTEVSQTVNGLAGARYFGFYSCNGIASLSSITIIGDSSFAIGEFGLAPRDRGDCWILTETSPGTDTPPADLGGYLMYPFEDDPRPVFQDVIGVSAPGGDIVGFQPSLSHRAIGDGWATWSHGYTGDVYYRNGDNARLWMPPQTHAFYLYIEPTSFGEYMITAVADDGTSIQQNVVGDSGARYYGFYTCGYTDLEYIDISAEPGAEGFAVGEFGIARSPRLSQRGDINCDGRIDFNDIDPFVAALGGDDAYYALFPCCYRMNADTNCDGVVDFDDIDPFVAALSDGYCACEQ